MEHEKIVQSLQNSESRIKALLDNVIDGIITIDEQGTIERFNPAAERIFGYRSEEVIGKNVKLLMPEPFHAEHDQYLNNYLKSGNAQIIGIGREVIGLRKDGSQFPCDLGISEVWVDDQRLFTGIIRDISERKQSEQKVKDSESRIKALLDNIIDGIITIDEQGTIERFNPAAERIFGYRSEEVIGKNVKLLMPEPFHAEHDQYLNNYLKTGNAQIIGIGREVIGLRKDGSQFSCDLGISEVWVDDQRLFTGIIRDISERKQSEQKVKDSESRIKALLDNVIDGIITIDEQGTVERFNPAAERIFGYRSEEVIGKNVKLLMPEPFHAEHDQYLNNYLKTGNAQIIGIGREVIGLRKDGSQFSCDLGISEVWVDDQRLFTGIIRDISERKQSEQKVKDSESRIKALLDNVIDGIITIDEQGTIERFNPAAERIFGYRSEEVIGKNVKLLMPEPFHAEHDQYLNNYLKTGNAQIIGIGREVIGLRKDGSQFSCDLGISEMWMDDQRLFTGIIRDISDRKEKEKELERAKLMAESANQAKSMFLANMSHEIRTPMNAIMGYAQILQRDASLSSDQIIAVKTISKSGDNLLNLINDILDISKIEAGRMELNPVDFDLKDFVDGLAVMFELTCEKKRLYWKVNSFETKVLVHGDEGKLRQALINIIGNAVKFTGSGGVSFNVIQEENDKFRFEIKDTGQGIPKESQKRIFEPFQQDSEGTKKGGTGLGLAISKKQIELMEGELLVESEIGQGSTFSVILPLLPAKREVVERADRNLEVVKLAEGQHVKVLVVDDIKENREVLVKLLEGIGMETLEAENGKEACERFRQFRPDVTFMDVRMPVMDGLEAIAQLRKEFPDENLNIIVISASVLKHEVEEYRKIGSQEIVLKPFRTEQVFASIKNLLGIKYDYKEIEPDATPSLSSQINFSEVNFSKEIIEEILKASSVCNITGIKNSMEKLEPTNNDERSLLNTMAEHLKVFDAEAIKKLLEKL